MIDWCRNNRNRLLPVLAGVAAVLPFLPALRFPFLYEWDDGGFLLDNPWMSWSVSHLLHQFTHTLQLVYTPLANISLMIDRALFGLDPVGSHAVNLLLFGGAAAVLYRIFRNFRIPAAAALGLVLLWAWNPARVETVAWVAERKGVLSALLAFGAFLAFQRRRSGWAACLTAAAILTKPWTLALPGWMFLAALAENRFRWRTALKATLPEWSAGIAAGAVVGFFSLRDLAGIPENPVGIEFWLGNLLRYLGGAVLPLALNPISPPESLPGKELAWGGLVLGGLLYCFHRGRMPWRIQLCFLAALFGTLLPVLGAGRFTNSTYADRYGFLASAVFWCAVGVALCRPLRRPTPVWGICFIGFLGLLGWQTSQYLPVFSDSAALFRTAAFRALPSPAPKAAEGLALTGLNRNDPALIRESVLFFRLRARRQIAPMEKNALHETADLLEVIAPALSGSASDGEKLAGYLEQMQSYQGYSFREFLDRAYGLAVAARLTARNRDGALRLLDLQQRRQTGSEGGLAFHAGLAAFLRGDYSAAVRDWRRARQLKPDDRQLEYNLKTAEEKSGLKRM